MKNIQTDSPLKIRIEYILFLYYLVVPLRVHTYIVSTWSAVYTFSVENQGRIHTVFSRLRYVYTFLFAFS
jgi:hypothetical protein